MSSVDAGGVADRVAGAVAGESSAPALSVIVSFDPDEQARNLGWLDQRYEQLSRGAFSGSIASMSLGPVTLFRETLHQSVHQTGCAPSDRITIAAPCQLSAEALWNGRSIDASAIIAFVPGREFDLRSPSLAVCAGISIEPDALSPRSAAGGADGMGGLPRGDTWMTRTRPADLGRRLAAVLDALGQAPAALRQPAARAQLGDELLDLVAGHLRDDHAPGQGARQASHLGIARMARELMNERIDQRLRVHDLCQAIGCSRRTLQYAFRQVFGTSPVAFLRTLRLNAVRRELQRPEPGTTVLDAAARHGFWHFPRFAQDYSRMFGELPSATLVTARLGAGRATAARACGRISSVKAPNHQLRLATSSV